MNETTELIFQVSVVTGNVTPDLWHRLHASNPNVVNDAMREMSEVFRESLNAHRVVITRVDDPTQGRLDG